MAITSRALAFASRWFDPQTVARVFDPLVADWQREWIDAPRSRRSIVHVKGLVSFCVAIVVSSPVMLRTRVPKSLTDQVARRIAIATGLGMTVLTLPFVQDIEPWEQTLLILFVIPQSMTLAFPFAVVSAVDTIRNFAGVEPHVARGTAAKLAVVAVLFTFVMQGWVVPAANQAWRKGTFHPPSEPARAPRELSTFELLASPALATTHEPGTNEFYRARSIRHELINRAAFAVLPVVLLWRRWRALDLPAGRWFSPRSPAIGTLAMIFMFIVLQFSLRTVEMTSHRPLRFSLWLILGLLSLLGMIRVTWAERSMVRA